MNRGKDRGRVILLILTAGIVLAGLSCKTTTSPCDCPEPAEPTGGSTVILDTLTNTQIFFSDIEVGCPAQNFPTCDDSAFTVLKMDTSQWHILEFEVEELDGLQDGGQAQRSFHQHPKIAITLKARECEMEDCDPWPAEQRIVQAIDGDSLMIVTLDPDADTQTFEHRVSGRCGDLIPPIDCADGGTLAYEVESFTSISLGRIFIPRYERTFRYLQQTIVYNPLEE